MRRLLLAALLVLPVVAPAQALVAPGTVTFGLAATFPPFEFVEDGKPVGFDIDLAALLTKQMALTSTIQTFEFKGLIPALLGKRIDAIISGMYINPEWQQVADFVPYLLVGNQVVVRKGNPLHLGEAMTLCGRRLSAPVGTVFEVAANKISAACVAAGKPAASLLALAGSTAGALALTQDRVDGIIVSTATAAALMTSTPDTYETAGAPFDADTKVGIAVGKENPELLTGLEKAMKAVVADGSYAALLKHWNLPASASPF
jgi:polar amino acid transport system substrate-binding protein